MFANVRSDGADSRLPQPVQIAVEQSAADEILFCKELLGRDLRRIFRIMFGEAEFLVGIARQGLDRGQHIDIAPSGLDIELAEFAGRDERSSFKASDEAVVSAHSRREAASDLGKLVSGHGDALIN